jgi:hypothetical protein
MAIAKEVGLVNDFYSAIDEKMKSLNPTEDLSELDLYHVSSESELDDETEELIRNELDGSGTSPLELTPVPTTSTQTRALDLQISDPGQIAIESSIQVR